MYGILTDIHFGIRSDSSEFHEIQEEVVDWVIDEFLQRGIKEAIDLGDWWDSRNELNVKTMNVGLRCSKKFENAGIKRRMVIGNHDTYYKNTIDISSLRIFEDSPNITVVFEPTEVEIFPGQKALFVPWIIKADEFKSVLDGLNGPWDYIFGHFDIHGGMVTKYQTSHGKLAPEFLTNYLTKKGKIITGHFHLNRWHGNRIYYVGSCVPLTWSDEGEAKFIHVLHENGELEKIENTISPRFIKVGLKELKRDPKGIKVKNNFIKLVIDDHITEEKLIRLGDILRSKGPRALSIIEAGNILSGSIDSDGLKRISDPAVLMREYVQKIAEDLGSDISVTKLSNLLDELFVEAQAVE